MFGVRRCLLVGIVALVIPKSLASDSPPHPGEAQCIDRIMERFAMAFKRANPEGSSQAWPYSEDAAYVLSFSLVMLNTDLHSQSLRDSERMTVDAFILNHRGIDEGDRDISEELLRALYDGIKRKEIKMDEGDLYESELITYMGARKAGWLEKFNKTLVPLFKPQWHPLWFVLNDGCLYYFQSPSDVDVASKPPRAIIPLDQGLEVTRPLGAAPDREFCLVRRCPRRVESGLSSFANAHTNMAPQQRQQPSVPSLQPTSSASSDSAVSWPRSVNRQQWAIKSVKNVDGGLTRVGTATEIRLRAKDVAEAQAWAEALRAEEETLPLSGEAAFATPRAAAAARDRRRPLSKSGAVLSSPNNWQSVRQENSHTPLLAGWLRKRGEINTAWKTRYFALFSGVTCTTVEGEYTPADEPVLMYFKDEVKFRDLVAGGEKPYKGAVRLGAVTEMRRKRATPGFAKLTARIALVTVDRVWLLAPAQDSDENRDFLEPWWYALEGACYAAQVLNAATKSSAPFSR